MIIYKLKMEDRGLNGEQLRHLYIEEKLSMPVIAKRYNTTRHIVTRWLKEEGIETRRTNHYLKEDFFVEINTEEKAYWLGFVWCDGNVNVRMTKKGLEKCFSLDLCERDHQHLYKFRESIGAVNKVEKLKAVEASLTSDKWRYRIRVKKKSFTEVLLDQYNMIPYRTDISQIKKHMPKNLMKHFIRGVLEADGSIMFTSDHKAANIGFSITYDMADYIGDYLFNEGLTKRKPTIHTIYKDVGKLDLYGVRIGGNIQTPKILDHLYEDATVFMDRKYDKYIEIRNYIERKEVS